MSKLQSKTLSKILYPAFTMYIDTINKLFFSARGHDGYFSHTFCRTGSIHHWSLAVLDARYSQPNDAERQIDFYLGRPVCHLLCLLPARRLCEWPTPTAGSCAERSTESGSCPGWTDDAEHRS
jgi:hypothetical protein